MTRAHQQKAVLGALVCVMVAVYVRAFRPAAGQATAPAPEASPEAVGTAPAESAGALDVAQPMPDHSVQRRAQQDHAATLGWARDPFTRSAGTGELSGFSLAGILWDERDPIAMINGQPVRAGDELEGYRIVSIGRDRVSLSDGTDTYQLLLAP